ncbi:MAG: restriction endonuclease, partial [Arcobacteraceae bacterium]|nr:restriction endonuclease [Arcobacteraceae bacterium]
CEYDEFSPNNELNQFFLYAVKYLQKFVKDKKLLKQCELIFDEVESWQIDINKLNIHFDRLNIRFKTSFEVAILLLKQSIPLFNQDKKSFAFLFDMNVLFEKFIARIVKEINHKAQIQNSYNFNDLLLKPDIILENQIIDTKYKKLKSIKELKQSDKLQAFAYGVNYDVRNVMLLYPKHLDEIKYNLVLGKEDKKVELKIQSIDLNYDGNDFTEYIETIKHKVREIV